MIRAELSKLLRRPRTWVTIALLAGLPVIVGIFVKASGLAPRPGEGPALLSEVLNNGLLFPPAALAIILPLFLPIAVSVIGGDTVAGEASNGTLRYLLTRPVGRSRLLTAKLTTVVTFIFLSVIVVALVALLAGVVLFGIRPLSSISATDLSPWETFVRTAARDLVHRLVDARTRRDRAVRQHAHRLAARRLARHAGGLRRIAGARPDRGDGGHPALLPTHYWLRFVDFTATRSCGATWCVAPGCNSCTSVCSSVPRGPTSPPRTSPADPTRRLRVAAGWRLRVAGRSHVEIDHHGGVIARHDAVDGLDAGQVGPHRIAERLRARPAHEHVVETAIRPRRPRLVGVVAAPGEPAPLADVFPGVAQHQAGHRSGGATGEQPDLVAVGWCVEVAAHHRRRVAIGHPTELVDDAEHGGGLGLTQRRLVEAVLEVGAHHRPRDTPDRGAGREHPAMSRRPVAAGQGVAADVVEWCAAQDGVVEAGTASPRRPTKGSSVIAWW
ncbi:MAG: ABC transporter permease [Ilumatobacteraceae bacterium]